MDKLFRSNGTGVPAPGGGMPGEAGRAGTGDFGGRAQLSEAEQRLQEMVRRIEAGRQQRAKESAIWREDPRRLEQRKDW